MNTMLASLTMMGALAIDTYVPSFPAIAQAFDVGPMAVLQTLSLFVFCFAFMMLFHGTLSDSFGRRPVLLWSLLLYSVASVGAALAPSLVYCWRGALSRDWWQALVRWLGAP